MDNMLVLKIKRLNERWQLDLMMQASISEHFGDNIWHQVRMYITKYVKSIQYISSKSVDMT